MLTRAARRFALARRLSTQAWVAAWGNNDHGRLGVDAESTNVRQPRRVLGLPDGVAPLAVAAGGAHTLVLLTGGEVLGFGASSAAARLTCRSHASCPACPPTLCG